MSKLNGDKARFQRERKAGLLRRERARAAYAAMTRRPPSTGDPSSSTRPDADPGPRHTLPAETGSVAD